MSYRNLINITTLTIPYWWCLIGTLSIKMFYPISYRCRCFIDALSMLMRYWYLIDIDFLSIPFRYRCLIDNLSILMSYQYLNNIDVLPIPYRCRCCTDTLKLSICFFNLHIDIIVASAIPYPYWFSFGIWSISMRFCYLNILIDTLDTFTTI